MEARDNSDPGKLLQETKEPERREGEKAAREKERKECGGGAGTLAGETGCCDGAEDAEAFVFGGCVGGGG